MEIKDSNITIMIKDMDTSIAFYQSIGFSIKQRWQNYYAQLVAKGITIGLHPANENYSTNNSANISIGFTTENFEAAKKELEQLKINFTTRQEEGGQFLHFTDPDGTALYFIKSKW
jgi:catechol 2,3-dioxygenase-like lactoylglutathione lyase family enzyme